MNAAEKRQHASILADLPISAEWLSRLLIEREAVLLAEGETNAGHVEAQWRSTLTQSELDALDACNDLMAVITTRLVQEAKRRPIGFAAAVRRACRDGDDSRWAIELHRADGYGPRTLQIWLRSRDALEPCAQDAAMMLWMTRHPDLWPHWARAMGFSNERRPDPALCGRVRQ